jgi:hypothetical protein
MVEIYKSVEDAKDMIKRKEYYDKYKNPEGKGILHRYQLQKSDQVILDEAIELTWQRAGSAYITYESSQKYIGKLNTEKFAGFNDWRLPTLEEAMSLMEPKTYDNNLHINPLFNTKQTSIWTSDKYKATVWIVDFSLGSCYQEVIDLDEYYVGNFVRTVRSSKVV